MDVNILDIRNVSILFKDKVGMVALPSVDGEMAVLDFHQNFVCILKKGIIKLNGSSINIKSGIAGMEGNKLSIFVERVS